MPSVSQNGKRKLHKWLEDFFLFSSLYLLTQFSLSSPDFLPGSRFSCNSSNTLSTFLDIITWLWHCSASSSVRWRGDFQMSCPVCYGKFWRKETSCQICCVSHHRDWLGAKFCPCVALLCSTKWWWTCWTSTCQYCRCEHENCWESHRWRDGPE